MLNLEIQPMESFNIADDPIRDDEGNINPFFHDAYHMGMQFSKHLMLMYPNHPSENASYLIIVNMRTGERARIMLPFDS